MKVSEICNRQVATVRSNTPLLEAARRMREEHVGDLVVVEERNGMQIPVGMLTDRDIVVGVLAKDGGHIEGLDVGDVIGPGIVTASEDEDIGDVLRRMRSFSVRRVPVVDPLGAIVGILSLDDLLTELADELAHAASLASHQREREPERRP